MPSRLSSLLVRDGLVGVKRMEKAFQRQVIYGGSLDTILLEMGLVPEDRLTQYLALASGLPPAARDEGNAVATDAASLISRELAERYRAVPVAIEQDAVRILVCAPLELVELEDLADLLDRPLQPLITPEYRWHLAYASVYGLDPPARFTTLARTHDVDPASTPVGRAPTVIVDERAPGYGKLAPVGADAETMKLMASLADSPAAATPLTTTDELGRVRRHTIIGLTPNRALSDGVVSSRASEEDTPPSGAALRARKSGQQPAAAPDTIPIAAPPIEPVLQASRTGAPVTQPRTSGMMRASGPVPRPASGPVPVQQSGAIPTTPTRGSGPVPTTRASGPIPTTRASGPIPTTRASGPIPTTRASGPIPTGRASRQTPISTAGRDSPLPIVRAREVLATAEDRDTVFLTLLRAARSRARWAGLLTVQGGAAIGRVALAEPGIDAGAVHTILIPLDAVSPFRTVVTNHQSHIGPLVSGDPSIDSMLLRMGGTMPPSALILPIVLRDRVVALVVAHRLTSDLKLVDVTELLPMANAASEAIGRLIVRHKAAGYRAPTDAAIVEVEAEMVDTKRITRGDAWSAPAPGGDGPPSVPGFEQGVEMSMEAGEPRAIDDVLSEIERADEGGAGDAIAEAVERAPETLGALVRRFPGKLRTDRFAVGGRTLRAAQYGGLLELVTRLGTVASELLIDRMGAAQRDTRFYATVCAAELRPRNAVFALAERMFDQDFGVRAAAVEALTGYPLGELGHALVRARRAVHSSDPDVVAAASGALVTLGDADAVSDLIGVVERGDRGGEHARRALVALTAQDFGASERKWRKWYDGARRRHRIEWLIEGLGHKDDAIRESAINVLRRLTGEYFGYHYDLPRKERDVAAERWAAWWRDVGHRRYAQTTESERHRPTAELPPRKD
jgi:hypothetical protein